MKMNSLLLPSVFELHKRIFFSAANDTIQLMHSFEVDIRICQPENSDVHRGEAEVNITFEG